MCLLGVRVPHNELQLALDSLWVRALEWLEQSVLRIVVLVMLEIK